MPYRLPIMRRLGRRGTALVILGIMWLLYGAATIAAPEPPRPAHPWLWHELLPVQLRAALWIVTGCCAFLAARWPAGSDRWGYTALVIMPMVRASSFGASAVTYFVTGGELGYSLAVLSALVWTNVVALVMLLAGWPEPADPARLQRLRRDVEQLGHPDAGGS